MKILSQILCLCSLLLLTGCDYIFPHTWRYKITVEIKTPEGIKSGYAVREVTARLQYPLNPDVGKVVYHVAGEAVVVDLGERGILFSLIGAKDEVQKAFPKNTKKIPEKLDYYNHLKVGSTAELPSKKRQFITFTDIDDPISIRTVEQSDFENVFGEGVSFNKITIEIVSQPVSFGTVREALKWFDTKRIGSRRWDPKKPDQANYLTKEDFIQGKRK